MSDEEKVVYELDVDVEGLPKGEPLQIMGLGVFENGSSYLITESEAERYRLMNATMEPIVDEDTQAVLGAEYTKSPTLLQLSDSLPEGITVSKHGESAEEKKARQEAAAKAKEEAKEAAAAGVNPQTEAQVAAMNPEGSDS
jgi:hypothetical protein